MGGNFFFPPPEESRLLCLKLTIISAVRVKQDIRVPRHKTKTMKWESHLKPRNAEGSRWVGRISAIHGANSYILPAAFTRFAVRVEKKRRGALRISCKQTKLAFTSKSNQQKRTFVCVCVDYTFQLLTCYGSRALSLNFLQSGPFHTLTSGLKEQWIHSAFV